MTVNNDDQWLIYTHAGDEEDYEDYEAWLEMVEVQQESEAELAALANFYRHEWESTEECE